MRWTPSRTQAALRHDIWIYDDAYPSLQAAIDVAAGRTLVLTKTHTLTANTTIGATISIFPMQNGVIASEGYTLTINGPVVGNPMHQWLSGFAAGEIKLSVPVKPEWLATSGVGTEESPYIVNFNVVDAATQIYQGEDNRSICLTGGKRYKINDPPFTLTYALRLYSVGGMAYIYNADGNNHAIVTPAVVPEGTSYSDYLTLSDFIVVGPGTGTGIGIYIQDATRWRLDNVICKSHGSHGLYVRGSSWIGSIDGGIYKSNGGDGIRIDTESGGAPNGITLTGVHAEGNTNWGVNVLNSGSATFDTVNVFGGVMETNTSGGLQAAGIGSLNLYGVHFEENIAFSVGTTGGEITHFRVQDCFGIVGSTIGGAVKSFILNGGRIREDGQTIYTDATLLTLNTRGKTSVKDWYVRRNTATKGLVIRETSPEAPTDYENYNIGLKGIGKNLIKNGAFTKYTTDTGATLDWTSTNIASQNHLSVTDGTYGLSPATYGKLYIITVNAANGNISQSFSFHEQPEYPFYVSAWVRVASGDTGYIEVTIGSASWKITFTNTNWERITIPCVIGESTDVSGTLKLGAVNNTDVAVFAEVQIVRDMNFEGFYSHPEDVILHPIIATGSIPASGDIFHNGNIIIEDNGDADCNLIIYARGLRYRIDGGAAF